MLEIQKVKILKLINDSNCFKFFYTSIKQLIKFVLKLIVLNWYKNMKDG